MLFYPQATAYKLDFEQERSDRVEVIRRFEGEREVFQAHIAKLNRQLRTVHLEHNRTVAQLRTVQLERDDTVAQLRTVQLERDDAVARLQRLNLSKLLCLPVYLLNTQIPERNTLALDRNKERQISVEGNIIRQQLCCQKLSRGLKAAKYSRL